MPSQLAQTGNLSELTTLGFRPHQSCHIPRSEPPTLKSVTVTYLFSDSSLTTLRVPAQKRHMCRFPPAANPANFYNYHQNQLKTDTCVRFDSSVPHPSDLKVAFSLIASKGCESANSPPAT